MEWHAEGKLLAIVSEGGSLCCIINSTDGRTAVDFKLNTGSAHSCRWSPDATQLATVTQTQLIVISSTGQRLSDTTPTSDPLQTFDIAGHPQRALAAILYANGQAWLCRHGQSPRFYTKLDGANFHSQIVWFA